MARDTKDYVAACLVCSRGKASHQPPAGLLRPLEIPRRPWSHIAVDFITGLPPSQGHQVVLTVFDRFSKSAHFIPLPKLPSAAETGELLVQHVFLLHGLPTDIVSDRGPQFCSQVWRSFCSALGASVSLTSGYHPQANGQAERTNQSLEDALRHFQTTTNLILLSMAVSDLLVGLAVMPLMIVTLDSCRHFQTTTNLLLLSMAVSDLLVGLAVMPFMIVTLDSFKICVSVCWTSSIIYNLILLKDNLLHLDFSSSCHKKCPLYKNYILGITDIIITFYGPLTVIIVLYARVFVVAVTQARAMRSQKLS
eukprot:XP_011617834.1 PREDICTED: D(3) dopamine receptor-like [Takifugu rubripes]